MSTLRHNNKNLTTQPPTILTLFYNEGEIDYAKKNKTEIKNIVNEIFSKSPDVLFIGNQESLIDFNSSFVKQIKDSIEFQMDEKRRGKVGYEMRCTLLGGSSMTGASTLLSFASMITSKIKQNKNIRSTLFIRKDCVDNLRESKVEQIGQKCNLTSFTKGTAFKDAILCNFTYNNIQYCIVNTHLSFTDKSANQNYQKRSKQLICLLKKVSNYIYTHNIIFGGDLNFRLLPKQYIEGQKLNEKLKYNSKDYLKSESVKNFNNMPQNILNYNELSRLLSNPGKLIDNSNTSSSRSHVSSHNILRVANVTTTRLFTLINRFKRNLDATPFYITCKYKENTSQIETAVIKDKSKDKKIERSQSTGNLRNSQFSGVNPFFSKNLPPRPGSTGQINIGALKNIENNTKKITYRMPSMCDRILYSFLQKIDPLTGNVSSDPSNVSHLINIYPIERLKLTYSDHLMLCAAIYVNK